MASNAEDRKEKSRGELIREFFEYEILHLLKSGNENPRITEHFMKRLREFLGLPESVVFPPVVLNDIESMLNLAEFMKNLKIDVKYDNDRIKKLEKELGQLDTPNTAAPIVPPVHKPEI